VIRSEELFTDDYRLFPEAKRNRCVQQLTIMTSCRQ